MLLYTLDVYSPQVTLVANSVVVQPTIQDRQEEYILSSNIKVSKEDAKEIVAAITKWAIIFKLDPKLMLAIARQESNFDKYAISSSGAYGIMQVIPVWHKQKVVDANKELGNPELFNINTNIYLGARVLLECSKRFKNTTKVLECYYGKPNTGYAQQVLAHYKNLS
jgi:soluble lytic murein transglycosylase-like protein